VLSVTLFYPQDGAPTMTRNPSYADYVSHLETLMTSGVAKITDRAPATVRGRSAVVMSLSVVHDAPGAVACAFESDPAAECSSLVAGRAVRMAVVDQGAGLPPTVVYLSLNADAPDHDERFTELDTTLGSVTFGWPSVGPSGRVKPPRTTRGRPKAHHLCVAGMVDEIRCSRRYRPELALVARIEDLVVGFVLLSGTDLVRAGDDRREVLTLTPLMVAPEHQRRGVGSELVRAALEAADGAGEPLVVVEGSPAYYGRLGFRFAGDHGVTLDLPDWAPREAAQVFLLSSYDADVRGDVEHPPAIAGLDA